MARKGGLRSGSAFGGLRDPVLRNCPSSCVPSDKEAHDERDLRLLTPNFAKQDARCDPWESSLCSKSYLSPSAPMRLPKPITPHLKTKSLCPNTSDLPRSALLGRLHSGDGTFACRPMANSEILTHGSMIRGQKGWATFRQRVWRPP